MVEYIIGNYLIESGKITKEQLEKVLERQDSVRVKLGLIAVAEGLITMEQAENINRLQIVMDKRFGDIAVEKGYLTEEQIGNLLKKQGNTYLMFVQALVDEGIVTVDEMDVLMDEFKKSQGFSNADIEDIKSDEVERIVPLFLPNEAEWAVELIGITVRTLIRFADRHIYIGKAVKVKPQDIGEGTLARQSMEGENGIMDIMSEAGGGLLHVCSAFGQEEFTEINEDSLDAAGELLNCINGLYVSYLSRNGKYLELMPPEYGKVTSGIDGKECYTLPIYIKGKSFYYTVTKLA